MAKLYKDCLARFATSAGDAVRDGKLSAYLKNLYLVVSLTSLVFAFVALFSGSLFPSSLFQKCTRVPLFGLLLPGDTIHTLTVLIYQLLPVWLG